MKTTAKLTLNVGYHSWERKFFILYCLFTCLADWKTSEWHLLPGDSYNKRFVLKNCVKTHLKIFLMKLCGILHTCRKGSSLASMKTIQIKLLLSRLIFNNLTKLTKILLSRGKKITVKGSGM